MYCNGNIFLVRKLQSAILENTNTGTLWFICLFNTVKRRERTLCSVPGAARGIWEQSNLNGSLATKKVREENRLQNTLILADFMFHDFKDITLNPIQGECKFTHP